MIKIGKLITDVQKMQKEQGSKLDPRDIAGINKIIFELERLEERLVPQSSIIEDPET